ncbi:hypothetical protein [Mycobacterium phage HC]|uniref:Uncharacterized protein n=4 Tax=Caudoviricetes TaxID=2731619 RepID=A0A2Z5XVP9_9CAUD|nr:DNA methyltransferase [Mycobacterium phage Babsiella]YP_009302370.1 DNA methyltransferase [Mycobacterium phage Xeno]YP_010088232.1 DNA methyltransferase [Mycobacterium phage HC]YP_010104190.1 DNA methyltransferase [Mycobacterium phage Xula]QFG15058.1 hypothetical protein PBI_QUEENHAZEL_51 [Mycobacterium phage QueenHazel]WRQ08769.1 hypothetical protein JDBV09_00220 [Mycobacterium phage mika]AER48437.1 hypothetical protein BABSIELLA_60 [Mycobacterium phage Babsiella]AMS02140.1 hypothetical 
MSDRIETTIANAIGMRLPADVRYAVAGNILDALKLARIALVELPQPDGPDDDGQVHYGDCGDIRVDTTARGTEFPLIYIGDTPFDPETLRRDAAAMLAAVDEAEK